MRYSLLAEILCLSVITVAAIRFETTDYDVADGRPFTIEWSGAEGPVKIILGAPIERGLMIVHNIVSGLSVNSFEWIPEVAPSDPIVTVLEISDSTGSDLSPEFTIARRGASTLSTSKPATSSDLATTPTAPSSPTSVTQPIQSGTFPNTPSVSSSSVTSTNIPNGSEGQPNSTGTSSANSDGLSTGAKAGIGAGVGVVGLIALVAFGWCMYHRSQQSRQTSAREHGSGERGELEATEVKRGPELDGQGLSEMDGDGQYTYRGTHHTHPGSTQYGEVSSVNHQAHNGERWELDAGEIQSQGLSGSPR